MEIQAILQYRNQFYELDVRGYDDFAETVKAIYIEEEEHLGELGKRIKELGGEPTADPFQSAERGQDISTIFAFDTDLESNTMDSYNQFAMICREARDTISARLLEEINTDEQAHFIKYRVVRDFIAQYGDSYLSNKAR